ncbi:hypothetical protein EHZ86_16680 [Aeromonas australiensis]|uniref:hypothetical protein n=1 Tax=Aeromonas australiensis TaxID=1114880 RepID=UPI001F3BEB0B|nr:hypothetical protein [Aeromonas australiensis]MCF3098873.1 hypothetical protein [Aeromonas australiensis]
MTLNEYLKDVEQRLIQAQNEHEVERILENVQDVLSESRISNDSQKRFWIDLYENLGGDVSVAVEKQGGCALSNIIAAAKKVIADKVKNK